MHLIVSFAAHLLEHICMVRMFTGAVSLICYPMLLAALAVVRESTRPISMPKKAPHKRDILNIYICQNTQMINNNNIKLDH